MQGEALTGQQRVCATMNVCRPDALGQEVGRGRHASVLRGKLGGQHVAVKRGLHVSVAEQ